MQHNEEREGGGGGLSRRTALKAGVAAGVGAVAWTGPTISSLGGTPAYAMACTVGSVCNIDLGGGCRNTDQGSGADFGYHSLELAGLPPGFSVTNPIPEGTACGVHTSTLNFPAGFTCTVEILFDGPPSCSNRGGGSRGLLTQTSSTGTLDIFFDCVTPTFNSNTQYQIIATCS